VSSFGVDDGVVVICVKQHLVQAVLYRVSADEIRSLLFDELFKSAMRFRMIGRSHVILPKGWLGQAFGGVTSTVGRRFLAVSEHNHPYISRLHWVKLYIHSGPVSGHVSR
jgi:hypothetical protein